jgi:hypothetical protein
MRKKISQQEPWKSQLDEARAMCDKEPSSTKRELRVLEVKILEDFIDASPADVVEALLKCREDQRMIHERLGGTDPPEPSREQVIDKALNKLKELTTDGWRFDLAKAYVQGMLTPSPRKGAPPNARLRSIKARDLRQMERPKTWLEIAKTKGVCDCGKTQHDRYCAERIRMGVRDLDKFIASMRSRR